VIAGRQKLKSDTTHTRAGSSSPSPSVGSSQNLKGNYHELQYKWTLIGEKLEARIEKSFEKLFRELKEIKKDVISNLRSQIEIGILAIKKSIGCEEIDIEFKHITSLKETADFIRRTMKSEVFKVKIEQEKILDISDYVMDSSPADPDPDIALSGVQKQIKRSHDGSQAQRKETSFTQFFENNKPDFIDSLDPETFFQNLTSTKRISTVAQLTNPTNSPAVRNLDRQGQPATQHQGIGQDEEKDCSLGGGGQDQIIGRASSPAPKQQQISETNFFEQTFKV
jgi:hypothetical protein